MKPDLKPAHRVDILIPRQLDAIDTGNGAYLETFLRVAKSTGLETRLIFAPKCAFGNRPWCSIHDRIGKLVDSVIWPGSVKIGDRYWSYSLVIWFRFLIRLIKEVAIRLGADIDIRSYLGRRMAKSEAATLARICDADISAITIAEYSSTGPCLDLITGPTHKGVLMHDLLSDRVKTFSADNKTHYMPTREEEAEWCRSSTVQVYASAKELETFAPFVPQAKSIWLKPEPPEYDETRLASTGERRVVFIGTVHPGNNDAILYFLEDIWPLVLARKPDAEIEIAGSVGSIIPAHLAEQPGVKIRGRVEFLESCGGSQALGIAPTRIATGVSIKVMEYLMLEMRCVATPVALEGFTGALDRFATIADTSQNFADAVVDFLDAKDTQETDARTIKQTIQRELSNQPVADLLLELASGTRVETH